MKITYMVTVHRQGRLILHALHTGTIHHIATTISAQSATHLTRHAAFELVFLKRKSDKFIPAVLPQKALQGKHCVIDYRVFQGFAHANKCSHIDRIYTHRGYSMHTICIQYAWSGELNCFIMAYLSYQ